MSKDCYNLAASIDLGKPGRPSLKAVLKELAWYSDIDGRNIWPSVGTLAERTDFTKRAVQLALRELEARKLIMREGSGKGGWRFSTHYMLNLDAMKLLRPTDETVVKGRNEKQQGMKQEHQGMNSNDVSGELSSPNKEVSSSENEKEKKNLPHSFEGKRQEQQKQQRRHNEELLPIRWVPIPDPVRPIAQNQELGERRRLQRQEQQKASEFELQKKAEFVRLLADQKLVVPEGKSVTETFSEWMQTQAGSEIHA